jgi:hypothetical protein
VDESSTGLDEKIDLDFAAKGPPKLIKLEPKPAPSDQNLPVEDLQSVRMVDAEPVIAVD